MSLIPLRRNKQAWDHDNHPYSFDNPNIYMRPATEDDVDNMYSWEMESIDKSLQEDPKVQSLIRDDCYQSIKDTQMIMDQDKTIGMFTACMIDNGEWRYIGEIYLLPEYRGQHIGSTILKNEIENYDKIRLQVAMDNEGALRLYKSLGFKIVSENTQGRMYIMELDNTKQVTESAFKLPDHIAKIIMESQKTRNRLLAHFDYDPNTQTIDTGIKKKNGEPIRIKIKSFGKYDMTGIYMPDIDYLEGGLNEFIDQSEMNIARSLMNMKNASGISFIYHELGHFADALTKYFPNFIDPESVVLLKKMRKHAKENAELRQDLDEHDSDSDEHVADTYAVNKTSPHANAKALNKFYSKSYQGGYGKYKHKLKELQSLTHAVINMPELSPTEKEEYTAKIKALKKQIKILDKEFENNIKNRKGMEATIENLNYTEEMMDKVNDEIYKLKEKINHFKDLKNRNTRKTGDDLMRLQHDMDVYKNGLRYRSSVPATFNEDNYGMLGVKKIPFFDSKKEVEIALKNFDKTKEKNKPLLAQKILSAAKNLGMDSSGWDNVNAYAVKSEEPKSSKEKSSSKKSSSKSKDGKSKKKQISESYVLEENDDFFKDVFYLEEVLKTKERNSLKNGDFALVYKDKNGKLIRKYPVHDESHVVAASKMFPRGVPDEYKERVARRILREAKSYKLDTSGWKSIHKALEKNVSESYVERKNFIMKEQITKILEAYNSGVLTQEEASEKIEAIQEEYAPKSDAEKNKVKEMKENWDEDYFQKIEKLATDEKSKMNPKNQRDYQALYEELKKYRPKKVTESVIMDDLRVKQDKIMESFKMGIINATEGMRLIERVMMEADYIAEEEDTAYEGDDATDNTLDDAAPADDEDDVDASVPDDTDTSDSSQIGALAEYINSLDDAEREALLAQINTSAPAEGEVPEEAPEGEAPVTEEDLSDTAPDNTAGSDVGDAGADVSIDDMEV